MAINFSTVNYLAERYGEQNPGSSLEVLAAREVVRNGQQDVDANLRDRIMNIFHRLALVYAPQVLQDKENDIAVVLSLSTEAINKLASQLDNLRLSEEYALLLPDKEKSLILRQIAFIHRWVGNLAEAERAALLIPDNKEKSDELRLIADTHRLAGNLAKFQRLIAEAERAALGKFFGSIGY